MFTPILELKNVSFAYPSVSIFQHFNLTVHGGQYIGIVGPNGSGKSTLLNIILGILQPQEGEILLFGSPLKTFNNWQKIGYVPQYIERKAHFPASVWDVVASAWTTPFPLSQTQKKAVENAMVRSNVNHLKHQAASTLSGGQLQRVFIARSLVTEPKLLILDEPTAGIDQQSQHLFYQFLRDLHSVHNVSILMVSHDIETINNEADFCVTMDGNIEQTTRQHHLIHS